MRGSRVLLVLLGACPVLLASGCGGASQDAHESKGDFQLKVIGVHFPAIQSIARPTNLLLVVRNEGTHTVPNVAVTIDSFYYTENYPRLAANKRPIWVIESGPGAVARQPVQSQAISPPGGGQTAYVNTWALGPLGPGRTQTFVWNVAPVKAGHFTLHYLVAAGLAGKARAVLASGGPVHGQLTATITPRPPSRHVDPRTGRVVVGPYPLIP